jgi:two-component system, NtrC family, nitrogen regulation sensor histidine kinase NtrY
MRKKVRKNFILSVLILAVIVGSNFLISKFVLTSENSQQNQDKITSRIEKIIFKKEFEAKHHLEELIKSSKQNTSESLFGLQRLIEVSENEKISFLIYLNDSLVYWSDNKLSIPDINTIYSSDSCFYKFNNGWYDIIKIEKGPQIYIAAILIKTEFKFENDYLNNEFSTDFGVDLKNLKISTVNGARIVKNTEGKNLFSITLTKSTKLSNSCQAIIIVTFFVEFIFLLIVIFIFFLKFRKKTGNYINALLFALGIIVVRGIIFYFKIPQSLYQTDFFSPIYYASSFLFPSLGDLFLNVLAVFIIGIYFFRYVGMEIKIKPKNFLSQIMIAFIASSLSLFLFLFFVIIIQSIILDSTISYNLSQVFSVSSLSVIGLLIISLLLINYFLFSTVFIRIQNVVRIKLSQYLIGLICAVGLLIGCGFLHVYNPYLIACWFIIYCVIQYFTTSNEGFSRLFYAYTVYLIMFTLLAYIIISNSNRFKEQENRKIIATKLASEEDPIAEYLYKDLQKNIISDRRVLEDLKRYPLNEDEIREYLSKKYFSGFWDKYKVQFTFCRSNDSLLLQSNSQKTGCFNYFNFLEDSLGKPTSCDNLYLINYGTGGYNYLSILDFSSDTSFFKVFIELNSKFVPKGLGYPELLIDKKLFINSDLTNYSYAKYYKNSLIDAYGRYYYTMNLNAPVSLKVNDFVSTDSNGYNHLFYRLDDNSFIIISKKADSTLDLLAPFSLLFSFFTIILIIFILVYNFPLKISKFRFDFKYRMQGSMISILLISFIIIGVTTYVFIKNLNNDKNIDNLREKSMSILIELQSKFTEGETMNPDQQLYLSNFLSKLSSVYFTDVNIFNTKGSLVSSSRPQVFNEGLMSVQMNPTAFFQLNWEKKTFYIQKENIGKLEYYSAYVPLYNKDNVPVYYINLPYFAKENELNKELSSFLAEFINIYVLFIAGSILISLFVAGRITRPLKIIREKIGKIKLGGENEKINWPRRDEIGSLIIEYNRMIDQISESATLLAKSERETAWREMAMQVAHEIKNPLTPMKLSIQYLDKAWKEKAPEWESILKRFSKNMVDQIDSLSSIASEFSYFAKMPVPKNEVFNIQLLIENSITIFNNTNDLIITLEFNKAEKLFVFADKQQIIRVMNNILHNAVQAIGNRKHGKIQIAVETINSRIRIAIKDNGDGISDEMKDKIFIPNFSTKSEGMGLGLAIVRGIIENCGGKIWFESVQNVGTTFFIELPQFYPE